MMLGVDGKQVMFGEWWLVGGTDGWFGIRTE